MPKEIDPFRTAEYQALRSELLSHIEAMKAIESETILGLGALGAWFLSTPNLSDMVKLAAVGLGLGFWLFNWARVQDRKARISRIAAYLAGLEEEHGAELHIQYPRIKEDDDRSEAPADLRGASDQGKIEAKGWEQFHSRTWSKQKHKLPRPAEALKKVLPSDVMVQLYYDFLWPALLCFAILLIVVASR